MWIPSIFLTSRRPSRVKSDSSGLHVADGRQRVAPACRWERHAGRKSSPGSADPGGAQEGACRSVRRLTRHPPACLSLVMEVPRDIVGPARRLLAGCQATRREQSAAPLRRRSDNNDPRCRFHRSRKAAAQDPGVARVRASGRQGEPRVSPGCGHAGGMMGPGCRIDAVRGATSLRHPSLGSPCRASLVDDGRGVVPED